MSGRETRYSSPMYLEMTSPISAHLAAALTLCAIGRALEHIRALQQIVYGDLKKIRDSQADIQRGSCVSVFQSGDIFLIAVQRCRKLFLRASALFPVRFDVLA